MGNDLVEYLRGKEWSMGNGQCPDCCGVPANWHGYQGYMNAASIGHKSGCPLASALRSIGEATLMIGEFKSDVEFENYITTEGFYGTRPRSD